MYDLIDRRRRSPLDAVIDQEGDGGALDPLKDRVYSALGFDVDEGSPELSDHEASAVLIEAAVSRLMALIEPVVSRRTRRYATEAGIVERVRESTTRSTRFGVQRWPERNLRAYFLAEVEGLSLAEIGRRLGISRPLAQQAKASGSKLVRKFARTKLDPRRPFARERMCGKNERPW